MKATTAHAAAIETLTLADPRADLRQAYLDMAEEFLAAGQGGWVKQAEQAQDDFEAFVRTLADHAQGINLPAGWVPYNDYWLLDADGTMLGRLNFRHQLTDHLLREGGHIGYCIRPSRRHRGYGTQQLALALERVRAFGLPRILITCDVGNVASAQVILNNGGILEDVRLSTETNQLKARYWIRLDRAAPGRRHP